VPDLVPVLGDYQFAPKRHTLLKTHGPHHAIRWCAASQSHAAGLTDSRQSQRSSKDRDDDTYGDEDDADDDISDEDDDEYFDDDDEGGDFDDVSGSLAAIKGYAGCALSSRSPMLSRPYSLSVFKETEQCKVLVVAQVLIGTS
jgi:hypothetical protein